MKLSTYKIVVSLFTFIIPDNDSQMLRRVLDVEINELVPFRLLSSGLEGTRLFCLPGRLNLHEGVHGAKKLCVVSQHCLVQM